jgi:hypothetical protein
MRESINARVPLSIQFWMTDDERKNYRHRRGIEGEQRRLRCVLHINRGGNDSDVSVRTTRVRVFRDRNSHRFSVL